MAQRENFNKRPPWRRSCTPEPLFNAGKSAGRVPYNYTYQTEPNWCWNVSCYGTKTKYLIYSSLTAHLWKWDTIKLKDKVPCSVEKYHVNFFYSNDFMHRSHKKINSLKHNLIYYLANCSSGYKLQMCLRSYLNYNSFKTNVLRIMLFPLWKRLLN